MGYCIAQTSLAHTYGNVASFVTEFIKNIFPENYFNTVAVTSTIAYKQLDQFRNSEDEYFRRNKPKLIVRPRIELNDSDSFLYNTFLTTRITDNYMDTSFTNLQPFIYDNERGNHMKFLLNRLKMFFEVTVVTETQIEQLNQAHFFKNIIRQERPFFVDTCLESFIPRELLELMGKDVGIPLYDENGSVKPFLDYINGVSMYPISYKLKNASGNDEFFRFYPAKIDTMITGLSISDGEKKGFIDYSYEITFTVSTEFNASGLYYYFGAHPEFIDTYKASLTEPKSDKIVPLFTIDNIYTERYAEGWNLYTSPSYMVEPNVFEDIMDIEPLFNNSMKSIIDYHNKHGVPHNIYMKVIVMKGSTMLTEGVGYEIDLETLELITKDIDPEASYRLIIHVNTIYINEMVKEMYNLDEEF